MNDPAGNAPRRLSRTIALVATITLGVLALLYTLGGFMLLPWYAQRELPRLAEQQLQRHARAGAITFNPFKLQLTVADFALTEKDGRPLLAFKHALVDLEWRSLVRRGPVFGEIRLDRPALHVAIAPDGTLNLAALAGGGRADAGDPNGKSVPADASPGAGNPRIVVGDLQIEHGSIDFEDQRAGYRNRFEELSFRLSSISTDANDTGPYALSAKTPGGAQLKWKGEASITPLAASGTLALEHSALPELQPFVKAFLNATITDGRASLELPYRFAMSGGKPRLEISDAKVGIESLALTAQGAAAPLFRLGVLALDGVAVDLAARSVSIGALRVEAPDIRARRDENGEIDLAQLRVPRAAETPGEPWTIAVTRAELVKGSMAFDDRVTGLAPALRDVAVTLGDVTNDLARPLPFEISATLASGGAFSARGRLAPGGALEAQVSGSAIALAPLQPLIARYANVTLATGEAAFAGSIKTGQKDAAFAYTGSAGASNVQVNDATGVLLAGWKSLATTSLRVQAAPLQVHIDTLQWQDPAGKFAIAADQTSNFRRALKRTETAPASAPAPAAGAEAPPAAAAPSAATDDTAVAVHIRRIDIRQGALDFADDNVAGGFATHIREFSGTVNGVSSDRSTRSQLSLEGRIDEYGYARVSGSLNPFQPRDRSSVRVELRNLDVAKVTPYAVRFAGYRIASGRLSLDLNYRVRNNLIEGDNQILLEQLVLGDKVETPGALNLPLGLAIALLKDDQGRIDLAVPVTGNLDDPKFDFGAIIGRVLGNVISGILFAPFKILARLFSGGQGDEFSNIVFEPGSARLLPPEREKLARIVQALAKRPELKLLVPARYDVELDARALRRGALRLELGKRAGFDIEAEDPPGPLSIDDRRTRTAVRELFAERFSGAELDKLRADIEAKAGAADGGKALQAMSSLDKIARYASGEPRVPDTGEFYRTLGGRLVASQPLPPDGLAALAQRRAAAIGDALKAAGVDAARVALTGGDPLNNPEGKNVALELALSAR
jgi:hypothetical protein